jgi:hypothetical protein
MVGLKDALGWTFGSSVPRRQVPTAGASDLKEVTWKETRRQVPVT